MDRARPFIGVVREVEILRRIFVYTHHDHIGWCLSLPSHLKQEIQAHILVEAEAQWKQTSDDPYDAHEKT
jgi:hypothetical protein